MWINTPLHGGTWLNGQVFFTDTRKLRNSLLSVSGAFSCLTYTVCLTGQDYHLKKAELREKKITKETRCLLRRWQQGKQSICSNELYLILYYTTGIWIPKLLVMNIMEKLHCTKRRENFGARGQIVSCHAASNSSSFIQCASKASRFTPGVKETASSKHSSFLLTPTKEAAQCQTE